MINPLEEQIYCESHALDKSEIIKALHKWVISKEFNESRPMCPHCGESLKYKLSGVLP